MEKDAMRSLGFGRRHDGRMHCSHIAAILVLRPRLQRYQPILWCLWPLSLLETLCEITMLSHRIGGALGDGCHGGTWFYAGFAASIVQGALTGLLCFIGGVGNC